VRLPAHRLVSALLAEVGEPLLSSTLILPGHEEPLTEGWIVGEEIGDLVDVIIEGECGLEPTTVIDFSDGTPVITRQGAGDASMFVTPD
jgi:tRNA A37 threonylcarbamoyladenosine synthetase subunit TsaC/SUA5/YrdC